jgi:hypothetical protein
MASVSGTFLGAALGHLAQVETPGVQLGRDGLDGGQLRVSVTFGSDQLPADFGSGQPAVAARALEGRVGLTMLLDDGLDVDAELRQMDLGALTAAGGKGIQTGDARAEFVQALAERIAGPAQQLLGLALAQAEAIHGLGHEAAACSAVQGGRGVDQQRPQSFGEFHRLTSRARRPLSYADSCKRVHLQLDELLF